MSGDSSILKKSVQGTKPINETNEPKGVQSSGKMDMLRNLFNDTNKPNKKAIAEAPAMLETIDEARKVADSLVAKDSPKDLIADTNEVKRWVKDTLKLPKPAYKKVKGDYKKTLYAWEAARQHLNFLEQPKTPKAAKMEVEDSLGKLAKKAYKEDIIRAESSYKARLIDHAKGVLDRAEEHIRPLAPDTHVGEESTQPKEVVPFSHDPGPVESDNPHA